jgi:hypothetical protein
MRWCLIGAQLGSACHIAISGTGALHAKAVRALSAYEVNEKCVHLSESLMHAPG